MDTPTVAVSQVQPRSSEDRLRGVEEALQQVSQQLASLSVRRDNVVDSQCFKCGQPGHLARNCRSSAMSQIECFQCGQEGHIARNCRNQLNRQGTFTQVKQGGLSVGTKCSISRTHSKYLRLC